MQSGEERAGQIKRGELTQTLLCAKQIANGKLLHSTGSSAQCSVMPPFLWDGSSRGRGYIYMYTYSWFTLLYSRNQHNVVKQLYFNKNKTKRAPNNFTGFLGGTSGKEPACQCRRHKRRSLMPESGRFPWRREWHPLQCSCLENPMDRGARQVTVYGVIKSQT